MVTVTLKTRLDLVLAYCDPFTFSTLARRLMGTAPMSTKVDAMLTAWGA